MTFDQLIRSRRSIRRFQDRPVPDELLLQLLQWGHEAPTGGNLCPWEFILLRGDAAKRAAVDATFCGNDETGEKHQEWLMTAPVIVAVCADDDRIKRRYGGTSIWEHLAYLDCSACIENILLGAVELGLGSCYISGFHETPMRAALRLPDHVRPIALLPVGWPDAAPARRPRPDLQSLIHQEAY